MAPIRKGDGTGLGAEGYSQVRKGDGTVLWNAISDSVDHQWAIDEGSGSTVADNQGSLDGSISGATWQTLADAVGGHYLLFNGTDDYISFGDDAFNFIIGSDYTCTGFVRPDSVGGGSTPGDRDMILSWSEGGTVGFEFMIGADGNLSLTHNEVAIAESSLSLTQGEWSFVASRYDATAEEVALKLNDQEEILALGNPQDGSGVDSRVGDNSEGDSRLDGGVDETTITPTYLSDSDLQTLQDRRSDI